MIKKEIDKYISKIPSSLSLFEIQKTKQQQLQKKKKKKKPFKIICISQIKDSLNLC